MNLPPVQSVQTTNDNEVVIEIALLAELEAFRGHFPDYPILPGVVQIDWAVRFAVQHMHMSGLSACDFQVKFRNIIRSGGTVSLQLKVDRTKNRLFFTYMSNKDVMSSGQIKLGTQL